MACLFKPDSLITPEMIGIMLIRMMGISLGDSDALYI